MSRTTLVKETLIDQALKNGDISTLGEASSVWRSIAEAEKLEADIAGYRNTRQPVLGDCRRVLVNLLYAPEGKQPKAQEDERKCYIDDCQRGSNLWLAHATPSSEQ